MWANNVSIMLPGTPALSGVIQSQLDNTIQADLAGTESAQCSVNIWGCGEWEERYRYQGQISPIDTSLHASTWVGKPACSQVCMHRLSGAVALYLPVKHDHSFKFNEHFYCASLRANKNFHLKRPKTLCYIKFYEQFPNSCTKLLVWWKSNNLFDQLLPK